MDSPDCLYYYFSKYFRLLRKVASLCLLVFSASIVCIGLFHDVNIGQFGGPLYECVIMAMSLLLLAANEGFQVGLLSAEHRCWTEIRDIGFPRAAKVHSLIFQEHENQLKRILIGQSFLVVLCSFTIAQLTTFDNFSFDLLPHFLQGTAESNPTLFFVFVQSGLPGVVITVICAQLVPSMLAKEYPLHCLNIIGIYSTIRLALLIEQIGIVKIVYSLASLFSKILFSMRGTKLNAIPQSMDITLPEQHPEADYDSAQHVTLLDEHKIILDEQAQHKHQDDLQVHEEDASLPHSANPLPHISPFSSSQKGVKYSLCEFGEPVDTCECHCSSLAVPAAVYPSLTGVSTYHIIKDSTQWICSFIFTIASICFVIYSSYNGYSTMSDSVSIPLQFLLLLTILVVVFYCEGLKIAVVCTAHLRVHDLSLRLAAIDTDHQTLETVDKSDENATSDGAVEGVCGGNDDEGLLYGTLTRADKTHYMLNSKTHCEANVAADVDETTNGKALVCTVDGRGYETNGGHSSSHEDKVKSFLLGRQMIVVPLGFLFAQLTHYSRYSTDTSWLPPALYFPVITVGIPGIVILLQLAQLAPQLVAEKNPTYFMNMIGCYSLAYTALCIESVGITDAAWVVYKTVEIFTRPKVEDIPMPRPPATPV